MKTSPTTYRLRRALEPFPSGDGDVLLLRDGIDAELVVERTEPWQLRILQLLEAPRTVAELARAVSRPAWEVRDCLNALEAAGALEPPPQPASPPLTAEQLERYDRQLAYFADLRPGGAQPAQAALRDATVAIVGVGGLGSWTATALACAGIGHLVLVDDDAVALSNLNRQILYRREDVGRPKVGAAAAALAAFDPELLITPLCERVDGPAAAGRIVSAADLVVETADWPPHELSRWLDGACREHAAARIAAAQFPPRIRIGPLYVPDVTACLECQIRAARREHPLYDRLVAFQRERSPIAATLGPASAIVGGAIAMEVVHHLSGVTAPATLGVAVTIDLRDWSVERHAVERDHECPSCGHS